jgi:hypothetical protein
METGDSTPKSPTQNPFSDFARAAETAPPPRPPLPCRNLWRECRRARFPRRTDCHAGVDGKLASFSTTMDVPPAFSPPRGMAPRQGFAMKTKNLGNLPAGFLRVKLRNFSVSGKSNIFR